LICEAESARAASSAGGRCPVGGIHTARIRDRIAARFTVAGYDVGSAITAIRPGSAGIVDSDCEA
jgi:hypothetical protein